MDQENTMDSWEEKTENGGNMPAPEVHHCGGEIKPIYIIKQMGQDEKSMAERRTCDAL
jgi:hypothetical protein